MISPRRASGRPLMQSPPPPPTSSPPAPDGSGSWLWDLLFFVAGWGLDASAAAVAVAGVGDSSV
uniref:Uncharacterized protein n=1 Tax=Arundo donax TaxID=35708 RepID=A0A0A9F028_ARUDO